MKITNQTPPQGVLGELTNRLSLARREHGLTQAELAGQAGVSKRTIERIENGCDFQLTTLARILRVLGGVDRLDQLVPEQAVSPMDMLHEKASPPQRVRRKKAPQAQTTWTWGDEQ